MPRWRCFMCSGLRLRSMDGVADAIPQWGVRKIPVEPDTHGLADYVAGRHEADLRKAAVATIVAVVAHEEIVTGRHDAVEIGRWAAWVVQHTVLSGAQRLACNLVARVPEPLVDSVERDG